MKVYYKNYRTTIAYEDNKYCGIIADIKDLIYFEGDTLDKAIEEFKEAVNIYIIDKVEFKGD